MSQRGKLVHPGRPRPERARGRELGFLLAAMLGLWPQLGLGAGPGDVVMIKGSLGTNMAPLVKAVRDLERRQPGLLPGCRVVRHRWCRR